MLGYDLWSIPIQVFLDIFFPVMIIPNLHFLDTLFYFFNSTRFFMFFLRFYDYVLDELDIFKGGMIDISRFKTE